MDDGPEIEAMEIDLEVADLGDLLEAHCVVPTVSLVTALWDWAESRRVNKFHN